MVDPLANIQQRIATSPTPAAVFTDLPQTHKQDVFFRLPETVQRSLVADMDDEELQTFVRDLDPDDATDVLELLSDRAQEAVLQKLTNDRREEISFLLGFDSETAAGVMDLDYLTVTSDMTFSAVAKRVRRFEDQTGRFPTIFVTDGTELLGELPGSTLALTNHKSEAITEYVHEVPYVRDDWPEEEVISVFEENRESTVAVVNKKNSIVGVIHANDILSLIEEEAGETLYEFTGVAEEESVLDGPIRKIRSRYKWLIINLGTAFIAAAVVGLFEDTIAALAVLAAYMLVIGVSMVLNLIIAGFFGALIPLILDRFGQDPATSATIFITTATDVLGFFAFLGLAQAILL